MTAFVLRAGESREGWSVLYAPDRDPIPLRVVAFAGDSLVLESAPYLSERRPGVRAVSRDVYRLVDGRLVGYSIGPYLAWPPHTFRLRLEGVRKQ